MLHVIWRRSVLSVSRTLSLVVQCGSFCGRWSKAVSQSRHPVACVCISLGHFKIGKNESTDRQRCHMLSMMVACYIRFDLLHHFILFLGKCAETCWRNLSSTWGPIHSLHGRGQNRSAGHGSSHGSLSVKLSIRLITSVSQCVKCLFHSVWALFSFADATHWPLGGHWLYLWRDSKKTNCVSAVFAFAVRLTSLETGGMGLLAEVSQVTSAKSFSNLFSSKLRNDAKGCKRPKGKLLTKSQSET